VPLTEVCVRVEPFSATRPTPDRDEKFCSRVFRPIVGFPVTPLALEMVIPEPTANCTLVTVLALFLTMIPVPAAFKLEAVPVMLICRVPPAPLSARDKPEPVVKYRAWARPDTEFAVRNG
jgi:hypothetical protein